MHRRWRCFSMQLFTAKSTSYMGQEHEAPLEPSAEEVWLSPDVTDPQDLTPYSCTLRPYDATH